jgi:NDP-sugar pyrophosphorylase family protein
VSLPVAMLAGGLATRLRPLTEQVPKILIDVAGRPFAEHQLDVLQRRGISRVVYCLGYLGQRVVEALGDGRRWGIQLEYVFDGPTLAGTGGALRRALPRLGDVFFVMYGDSYLDCDYAAVERAFRASGKAGLMTVYRNDNRFDRSNVRFEDGRIVSYDKEASGPAYRHIDYGLGVLTARAFAPWRDVEVPFDLGAVYHGLLVRGDLTGYEMSERFFEIGSLEGLEETRRLLSARGAHVG